MRIRFLATDYAAVTGDGGYIDFLPLPCPCVSTPDYSSASVDILGCFDELPVFGASDEDLEKWQIDDALWIFLSDVLPHFIDCEGLIDGKGCSEVKLDETPTDKDGASSFCEGWNQLGFMQFEVPKMDASLLSLESPIDDCLHPLPEFLNAEFTTDALNDATIPHRCAEVHKSVFSVDYLANRYSLEKNASVLEDADALYGSSNLNEVSFPLFELDMDNLGVFSKMCISELPFADYIEKQQLLEIEGVNSGKMELSGFINFDLIKYIIYDSAPNQQTEQRSCSSESSFTSIPQLQHSLDHSYGDAPVDDSISSVKPIIFDDILFFDADLFILSEGVVDSAKVIEVEDLESMFSEVMNFRSFNQLVVCHELTLMDDSFRTMPAPIFSDHESKCSLSVLVDEILAQLNKVSLLASDGLYLDWSFLEDALESIKYSYCKEILCEIDTSKTDDVVRSHDGAKLMFDFILTEDSSNETKTESYNEIVNQLSTSVEEDLNKVRCHGEGKRIHQDIPQKTSVEKFSMHVESMSSDLKFFLDPSSYAKGKECVTGDQPGDTNMMHELLIPNNNSKDADMMVAQETFFVQTKQNSEPEFFQEQAVNENEGCSIPGQTISVKSGSEKNLSCSLFSPDTVIVVNTQNVSEEMIISRRTIYQRILEIEQGGAQVVERDINLPIDLVISSAVCLAWYDSKNIGMKASAPDAALSLCIESIAANVLTSLSFAFSCCILLFEGEASFIHGVMESSEELFAAAASLGIDIQLFYSHSAELTEEIILSSINIVSKSGRGQYPRMPDSESLGESFLTAFPSVNPLSAHAILSSDVILGKFLEMPNEGRNCALERYMVPKESIALLSVACRYGEREDSRSTTTDCSSSLSVPEYEDALFRGESGKKKPKHWHNMDNSGGHLKENFLMESLKDPRDDSLNFPMPNPRFSGVTEMPDRSMQFSDTLKNFTKSSANDFPLGDIDVSGIRKKSWVPPLDEMRCVPTKKMASKRNISCWDSRQLNQGTEFAQDNITGEIIDAEGTRAEFMEDLYFENADIFSPFLPNVMMDQDDRISSRIDEGPFTAAHSPMFNATTDFDYASAAWIYGKNDRQGRTKEVFPKSETIKQGQFSMIEKKELMKKYMTEESSLNWPLQGEKRLGGTLLSEAMQSRKAQQGSPWTIEFLNRIREKSRLHKQAASNEVSSPHPYFASIRKSSNAIKKRKSPSILKLYEYKGPSIRQKIVEPGRPKRSCLKSLQKKKASNSYSPSWTPVDKRARRTLSFATNGSGGQSKLVWGDNHHLSVERRF